MLVATPSLEVQEQRLRSRGDDEASVQRRLEVGADEQHRGRRMADHVVVNDDLGRATKELAGILASYRQAFLTD